MQARRREQAVHRVGHQLAQRHRAGQPVGRLHAVHVVAHQQRAQLLEDQDQRIGHQHLLQVVAFVQVAVEGPFQQVAEQRRQQQPGQQHEQEVLPEQRRQANAR
jgi:hypothetical protein